MALTDMIYQKRIEPESNVCFFNRRSNCGLGPIEHVIICICDDRDMQVAIVTLVRMRIEQVNLGRKDLLHTVY
ncbi:hypothetical protein CRI93_04435 [Longimonas halophila]|uniref:Uncharacterized protein n=1 Tax=Longimonas halophila TaxID=1469170 RepID=A0A2H3P740_9BACT|nr:hypothetical protein CRI93_04435 [Longimonas halophila]